MTATTVVTRGTGTVTATVAVFVTPAVVTTAPAGRKSSLFGSVQQ